MNFSEMPVEIWADLLEEQGEDTTELREWIASGLKIEENSFYSIDNFGCGIYRHSSYGDSFSDYDAGGYISFGQGFDSGDDNGSGDGYSGIAE